MFLAKPKIRLHSHDVRPRLAENLARQQVPKDIRSVAPPCLSAPKIALAVAGRRADAEDMSQDAFVIAFEGLEMCGEPARLAG